MFATGLFNYIWPGTRNSAGSCQWWRNYWRMVKY